MPVDATSDRISPAYALSQTCWQRAVVSTAGMSSTLRSTSLAVAAATLLSAFGCQSSPVSSSARPSVAKAPAAQLPPRLARTPDAPRGGIGTADGLVPSGVSVHADIPAVTRLDPALLRALRKAATDARQVGIRFYVDSGWRSPAYQEELLRQAIAKYGSRAKAARWVATPDRSAHVSGDAVDIGHAAARTWLAKHGAAYGLCRTYRNEPWHFELRPEAVYRGCPRMYADPTHDPRMQ